MLSLLGSADSATLRRWSRVLRRAPSSTISNAASDGQVIDRYGVHWLIGFEDDTDA